MDKINSSSVAGLWPHAAKGLCAKINTLAPSRHEMLARQAMHDLGL